MKKNMGTIDRVVRGVGALAIAGLYFGGVVSGPIAIGLGVVGAIFAVTSTISFCPAYLPLGINTCGDNTES